MAKLPKEVQVLVDALTDSKKTTYEVKKARSMKMGALMLYVYDAKTKAKLPVWDKLPLIILLDKPQGKYIIGINIHYIPYSFRINLIKELQSRGENKLRIKYSDVLRAWKKSKIPGAYLKLAIRKYLANHIRSNIRIFTGKDEQLEIVRNVLPQFVKKSMSQTYKDIDQKIKQHKQKSNK